MLRLLPPFLLLRRAEPPFVYKQESILLKRKNKNVLNCQMQDRGSHQEPAYDDHKEESEVAFPLWPPHQGYGPRKNKRILGTGCLIMIRPAYLSLLPGE